MTTKDVSHTARLTISDGQDWLLVKQRLSDSDKRDQLIRTLDDGEDGPLAFDRRRHDISLVVAYLSDWSLVDDNGKRVVIKNVHGDDLVAVLSTLTAETFKEIVMAIRAHDLATR